MEDDRLDRALRELARQRAQDGFTARVLRRVEALEAHPGEHRGGREQFPALAVRVPPRASAGPPFLVAGALLAALAFAVALPHREGLAPAARVRSPAASLTPQAGPPLPDRPVADAGAGERRGAPEANLDRLQARRLLRDLRGEEVRLAREIQSLRRTARSQVIYLGGDEDVDMVIDLNRVPEARRAAAGGPPGLM